VNKKGRGGRRKEESSGQVKGDVGEFEGSYIDEKRTLTASTDW